MSENFNLQELKKLYKPLINSNGEDNGQVTIIGGSSLFHGAPLLSLKVASRIVGMVFFSSPEPSVGKVAENFKSKLFSFIWVPWEEIDAYIKKSDAVLIGPGFMRFDSEKNSKKNEEGKKSREITKRLLEKFPDKKWVIDAGSLQVMEKDWIPRGAILTPNKKEYSLLFGNLTTKEAAKEHDCIIVRKGSTAQTCSPKECIEVNNGNIGLAKGGTGDVLAGLTVALLAKNDPFLAAASASFISKTAADELYREVGMNYNADDLAEKIPSIPAKFS
jgi:hydroxyethylthiazole kinase-like uncharacterized protein yjeF